MKVILSGIKNVLYLSYVLFYFLVGAFNMIMYSDTVWLKEIIQGERKFWVILIVGIVCLVAGGIHFYWNKKEEKIS